MPSLKDMLACGVIEPLEFSASRADVRATIGEPEGDSVSGDHVIEKRGDIQLEFRADRLIRLYWYLGHEPARRYAISDNTLTSSTEIFQFVRYCDEVGIYEWTIDEKLTFDRQLTIKTSDCVVAIFDLDSRSLQKIIVTGEKYRHA